MTHRCGDYGRPATPSTWAERPIFSSPRTHSDVVPGRYKMRLVRERSCLAVVCASVAATTLAVAAGATAATTAQTTLQKRLARALAVPQVDPRRSAALAVDLATGRTVFARNPTRSLAPASNEKLPVTYAALVVLGPSFRIRTEVLGEGRQDGKTWDGRLVLKGYGDPTLATADLRVLARGVRRAGITHVTGGVAADETLFDRRRTAPGWRSYFFLNESPPLSALAVNRASFHGRTTLRPAVAAASELTRILEGGGVSIGGKPTLRRVSSHARSLATVVSPSLWAILRFMGRESDNFTAELLLKQLGALYGGKGTTAAGAAVVTRILAADGIPLAGVRIVDGSGLSRLNRLTAQALIAILRAAWASPELRRAFLTALPVAGKTGTLRRRMTQGPARGNVFAKTGTTSQSSALSGFVRHRYAFAVLQNGSPVATWWAQRAQDRFVAALAAAK